MVVALLNHKKSPKQIINQELYFPGHDKVADKICHTAAYTAKATKPETQ
jgi:hypothetical protein